MLLRAFALALLVALAVSAVPAPAVSSAAAPSTTISLPPGPTFGEDRVWPKFDPSQGETVPGSLFGDPLPPEKTAHSVPALERIPRGSKLVDIYLNGDPIAFPDVEAHMWPAEGRTFVPIRFVSERLGAKVAWFAERQEVLIELPGRRIELWVGKPVARVNGAEIRLEVAPYLFAAADRHRVLQTRTLVPLRLVTEGLGAQVDWVPPPLGGHGKVLITAR